MDTAAGIMKAPVVRIAATATAAEALDSMRRHGVTCVLVEPEEPGESYGIFSQTDAVAKIVADQLDPGSVTLRSVMSRPVITVPPETSVVDCALVMRRAHVHRVLVHDGNDVIGLVSASDILGLRRR